MHYQNDILSVYNKKYAESYESLYLDPWPKKHKLNLKNISDILQIYPHDKKRWLDICCGQAWHFSRFPGAIEKVGIDISAAQLKVAKERNPDALFIQNDILNIEFPDDSFDLITCFWAAYCYLNSFELIERLLKKVIDWIKMDGVLYFEILLPEDLKSFNQSDYAVKSGFSVIPRKTDFSEWSYQDVGGVHNMTSPPLMFFYRLIFTIFSKY
jgi:SAM-dependent methyltransferase